MNSLSNGPTFIIKTLGCKVNQYESEMIKRNLLNCGFREGSSMSSCDFYIINSCTVTHKADRDTRRLIRHVHEMNPQSRIVVCGCYAEFDEDRSLLSQIPGVAYLLRNKEKAMLGEILNSSNMPKTNNQKPMPEFKNRDRAFIKIQDGCNHRCSYCKVALVRGRSESKSIESVLSEAQEIVDAGYKEIVLVGVCLGAWGEDFKIPVGLDYLLEKILDIDGDFRIRLSSIEPVYVTEELINKVSASSKICKHLHIPLQHGDDRILKLMNRDYNTKGFSALIKRIRRKIPDFAFTTDVMLGFPGEDGQSFKKTSRFIKKIKPSRIHVFSYSERTGTTSRRFGNHPNAKIINERVRYLMDLAKSLSMQYANRFMNKTIHVLVESKRDKTTQLLTGYTDRYIKVLLDGPDSLMGSIVSARIYAVSKQGNFARPRYLDKAYTI